MTSHGLLEAYEEWKRRSGIRTTSPNAEASTAAMGELPSASVAAPSVEDYEMWKRGQLSPTTEAEGLPPPSAAAPSPSPPLPSDRSRRPVFPPGEEFEPLTLGRTAERPPLGTRLGRLGRAIGGTVSIPFSPLSALTQFARPGLALAGLPLGPTPPKIPPRPEAGLFERLLVGEEQEPLASQLVGGLITDPTQLFGPGAIRLGGRAAAAGTRAAREAVPLARPSGIALAAPGREVDAATARVDELVGRLEQARQRLDEAEASLEATLARGKPAPRFGTAERAEFDVARRGQAPKAKQVQEARASRRAARQDVTVVQRELEEANSELDRLLMDPVTEPVVPASRLVSPSTEPAPTIGVARPGLGIGERAAQGELGLGGRIAAQEPVPLIDAQQVAERQRLAAERAAGQQELPAAGRLAKEATETTPPALPPSPPAPPAALIPSEAGAALPGHLDKQRILSQAKEIVRQDRPGAISNVLQKVPVVSRGRVWERPGLAMTGENENVLVAHVAENLAGADVRAQATASRVPIDQQLVAAFGRKVVEGAESPVRFLGTAEQASSPLTGTLVDIAENPELYALTTAQKEALVNLESRNTGLLQSVKGGYGLDVGQYPAKPGGAFLTHIDMPEDYPAVPFSRDSLNVARGQSKSRFYQTARERLEADPTYKPELNVTKLLDSMDNFKVRAASGETFREAVGGLTKLEAMEKTHPNLFNRMTALQSKLQSISNAATRLGGKQKDVIDTFLSSPLEEVDMTRLQADLNPVIAANAVGRQGPNFGKDLRTLRTEIAGVKNDIANLRPAWNNADLKPYAFVQQGLFRYFPREQAGLINELRKVSTNPVLRALENIRGGAFSGDLSPFLGVQTPLGILANPIGSSKMAAGAIIRAVQDRNLLRSFSSRALAEDMAADPSWREYASFIGRAPTATPAEFSAGYLGRIPVIGSTISKLTEGSYVVVTRQSKGLWESMADSLMKSGLSEVEAKAAAASVSAEVFPLLSSARLGQSQARNAMIRAIPTSYSFIRQPASLITQASRGYVKLGLKQTLTPQERLAVQIATTMAASVMSASVVSGVLSAEATGRDMGQAALDAVNPDPRNGRFASLILGENRIPLGGPYRALFRAIYPKEVSGLPVPVPFGGLPGFVMNRLNPAIGTQMRLYKNKDFYGRTIRQGTFPEQLLQSLAYEMQGVAPLTIGTVVEGARGIASPKEIATQAVAQFAGSNVSPTESARETAAKYEQDNRLPPDDASLTILRTAYYQAGEGLLSDDAKKEWRKYEPLPKAERKLFLRSVSPEIGGELHRVEFYRTRRRSVLARHFPDLDVLLVEEHWQANSAYKPLTTEGKNRQRELRSENFPTFTPTSLPNGRFSTLEPYGTP